MSNAEEMLEAEIQERESLILGNLIIDFLHLRVKKNGRVDTLWGDKTPIGLGRCIERIINERAG